MTYDEEVALMLLVRGRRDFRGDLYPESKELLGPKYGVFSDAILVRLCNHKSDHANVLRFLMNTWLNRCVKDGKKLKKQSFYCFHWQIARGTGLKERSIRTFKQKLRDAGFIDYQRELDNKTKKSKVFYTVNMGVIGAGIIRIREEDTAGQSDEYEECFDDDDIAFPDQYKKS